MSAPGGRRSAVARAGPARRARRTDRGPAWSSSGCAAHTVLVYAFLYVPILVVVLFAFNGTNRRGDRLEGFSLRWYGIALDDRSCSKALLNSFSVAIPNAILATTFGTMAALGLQRVGKRVRMVFDGADLHRASSSPRSSSRSRRSSCSRPAFDVDPAITSGAGSTSAIPTIIAAHVLFNISLVLLLVRARLSGMDRTLVEASDDLYATPWRTFRQITFPQLLPAIVAGFLLSFTFSFDDYVITSFVSGPGSSTLPLFIFGQVKHGVTPGDERGRDDDAGVHPR